MIPNPLRVLPHLPLAVLVALSGLAPRIAGADTAEIDCYHESYDLDGDGYAKTGTSVEMTVDEDKKLYCPSGWVPKNGDCDDTRPEAHPHAPEIAFNGQNDDCNSGADEPEIVYFPNGNQNTKTSFSIRVRLASFGLVGHGSSLAYDVEYADLATSQVYGYTVKRGVGTLPSDYAFDAPVGGLQPARVYRARLRFYKASTPPPPLTLGGRPTKVVPTYTPLGITSEWYYTATEGDGSLEGKRTEMLLEGFYQLSESDHGRVGYRGTVKPDGTRYGAAAKERWCSEFYTWLAGPHFWLLGAHTTVGGVIYWFRERGAYHMGHDAIPAVAVRGDYIPVDSYDDGDTAANHSTMFLAYDLTTGKVWTLEGNSGNYVRVEQRPLDSHLKGVGSLPSGS